MGRGRIRNGPTTRVAVAALVVISMVAAPSAASAQRARPATPAAGSAHTSPSAALPPGWDHAPLPLPAQSVEADQLYRSVVGRPADRGGLVFWGGRLDAGIAPAEVARALAHTPEVIAAKVASIYQAVLGRAPDSGGLAFWTAAVQRGTSLETTRLLMALSPEATARAGGSVGTVVDNLYLGLLERPSDPAGRAYWVDRLTHGAAASEVAMAFLQSSELATRVVDRDYQAALFRPADPAGLAFWSASYSAGATDELALLATLAGSPEAVSYGCDPFGSRSCLTPFPNDYYTTGDASTPTGRRVALKPSFLPANANGKHVDPTEWNRNDGFSPGQALVAFVPGINLAATGAAPVTNMGSSLAADAPIVVIDASTGERRPYWAELDENSRARGEANPALYVRPAVNWLEGHRYIVALRNIKGAGGTALPAPEAFAAYRDATNLGVGGFEARKPHMEQVFANLAAHGVARSSLYLAWDFTVASSANLAQRMIHIRDDAFADLGASGAPSFTAALSTDGASGDASVVSGTFAVPSYLTNQAQPGSQFVTGPNGLPQRNGTYEANYTCVLPYDRNGPRPTSPAPGTVSVVYGHGLLGTASEVHGFGAYAIAHNTVLCATDWIGLADRDTANAVSILQDISRMPTLADRGQQSFLNFQYLARLMKSPSGFATNPLFQAGGASWVGHGDVSYWGRSQGGIWGGGATATSKEWTRALLGEPGMNYATLLDRSVDFDDFVSIISAAYPDLTDRPALYSLIQMLWDRSEAQGYAQHLTDDPLPNTPAHRVMLFEAFGDHQVANVATEVEARTIGAHLKVPALAPGRSTDVTPYWGIPPLPSLPADANALYPWDWGTPAPPTANLPNRAGLDPHDFDHGTPAALDLAAAFLAPGGAVIDACAGQPCISPPPP